MPQASPQHCSTFDRRQHATDAPFAAFAYSIGFQIVSLIITQIRDLGQQITVSSEVISHV